MSTSSLDESNPRSRWLARGSIVLLAVYWLALITATHLPKVPEPLGFRPSDKLLHFTAYAVLGAMVGLVCSRYRRLGMWMAVALLMGLAAYAALDEVTQPLVGRTADVADWCADVLGAALGLGVFLAASTLLGPWWNSGEKQRAEKEFPGKAGS